MAGDIVAKLGVDGRQWSSGLATARGQMTSFVGAATRAFAPLGAALGAAFGAKESVAAYQTQLTNARKLNSVLAATGGAAGLTGQQIADYASELQKTTNFEDDATVAASAMLASFTNVRGDVFKGAIAGAMDMATVLGTNLTSNVQLLGKALNDPIDGLAKLGRSGVQFTEQQRQQIEALQQSGNLLEAQGIILDTVASKFGGAAEASAEPLTQLQNTIGDVAENIGSMMLPALTVGADAMKDFLGEVAGGADSFKEFGIEVAVNLSHISGLIKLASLEWSVALMEWLPGGEAAFQTIGATINATLEAGTVAAGLFVQNFTAGLIEIKNFAEAVFAAMAQGLSNTAQSAKGVFQDTLSLMSGQLPKAKAQAQTKTMGEAFDETLMKQKAPDGGKNFVTGFREKFNQTFAASMQGFGENGGMLKGLKGERDALANNIGDAMQKQRKELQDKFSPNRIVPVIGDGEMIDFSKAKKEKAEKEKKEPKEKALKEGPSSASAAFLGSQESARMMTKGIGGNPMAPLVSISQQQLAEEKRIVKAIEAANKNANRPREKVLFFDEVGGKDNNKVANAQLAEQKKMVAALNRLKLPNLVTANV